ncbi:MAG TPA: transcription termination factor NusA [Candidatus Paceibacterota bacterium]|nr:transcription termination factor NusA [Candidatus Paceibacterota bacterium]
MAFFDLKAMNVALDELEAERGISREQVLAAIETAMAAAYRREYGKRGQIVRATFDPATGDMEFRQAKIVVDETLVRGEEEEPTDENDMRSRFNPEQHIMLEDAQRIRKDAQLDEEISFPLEAKDDFGRIAAQAAKQVILQKIREAERVSIMGEFGEREGEIVTGHVQRFERGNLFIDLGRSTGILPYDEQIPGERYRQGERIRALLYRVDSEARGSFLRLSRSHPRFLVKLFEAEVPELAAGTVEVKAVVREPGSRAKIAVVSNDPHIDPVGSLVGQRGVRVAVVTSELGGEKIDVIEWSEDPAAFVEEALKPAEIIETELIDDERRAIVSVAEDQQSVAIGRGGQNVRLAARLTGWKIDIRSLGGDAVAETDGDTVAVAETPTIEEEEAVALENETPIEAEQEPTPEMAAAEPAAQDAGPAEPTEVEEGHPTEEVSEDEANESAEPALVDDVPEEHDDEPVSAE